MKPLAEIGWTRAARFGWTSLVMLPYRLALAPPLRVLWLRLLGARIGAGVVLHDVRFFNLYRRGLSGLTLGPDCFLGDQCLVDLAEAVTLEAQVTLAERVMILTHTNVGYRDHPLQTHFPASAAPVTIKRGSFVGAQATILPGRTIGPCAFVGAGSVVTRDVPAWTLAAGVPARPLRSLG